MPPLERDSEPSVKLVLTNSGPTWTASDGLWIRLVPTDPVRIAEPELGLFLVDRTVPTGGAFEIQLTLRIPSFSFAFAGRLDIAMVNGNNWTLDSERLFFFVGSAGTTR